MNNIYLKYFWILPVYILIQILVLNEILFYRFINPYIYLALIIRWPLKTNKWGLLLYAFLVGFLIDIFSGSLGFHSTATVFIAFLKPTIAKITIPHNIIGDNDNTTIDKIGTKAFVTFSLILILIHNSVLFILEHLDFCLAIGFKILASSIITLILILIIEISNSSKK
jgi:cell shape-determining protein MreD